ncbi:hypothetical protein AYO39_02565 [Actinobacteria bacterium SCGC AG-212-D09]|nr:hypothetical protein AYO39_02565 [Actinobacteria bacterium SCGC AG-212-D09]
MVAVALTGTATARVAHLPCPNANGGPYTLRGDGLHNLPPQMLYERHADYRQCGHLRGIPDGQTRQLTVECRPGFKLAGTSQHHHNAHTAHWDFYSQHGESVTWTGGGHFHVDGAGWATGYTADLHNSNLLADAPWPVMIFATCDRIPDYRFG